MSTQPNQTQSGEPVHRPEAFAKYSDRLKEGYNLFQCSKCGHFAGDPKAHSFLGKCPECNRLCKFFRIIE